MNPTTKLSDLGVDDASKILDASRSRLANLMVQRARLGYSTPPEIITEIEDIQNRQIPDLRAEIAKDSTKSLPDETQNRIQRLKDQALSLESKYSPVVFVNRDNELGKLVDSYESPPKSRLFIVEAPTGYGKTHLLTRAKREFEEQGWLVCSVDLSQNTKASRDKGAFVQAVRDSLPDSLRVRPLPIEETEAIASLLGTLAEQSKPLVLLVDSAERIKDKDFIKWFYDKFVDQLGQAIMGRDGRFRAIISGRYIAQYWARSDAKYGVSPVHTKPLRLEPFGLDIVMETVRKMDAERASTETSLTNGPGSSLNSDALTRIAEGVQMICAGHPRSMVSLLQEVRAEQKLTPYPTYFQENREALFKRHVEPVCRDILLEIPEELAIIFPYLALFRCFNNDVIKFVLEWMREHRINSQADPMKSETILRQLTNIGLIVWNREKHFFTDDVARRIICLSVWLNKQKYPLAYDLNQKAISLYDTWLNGPVDLGPSHYESMIVEHLFHQAVNLERSPRLTDANGRQHMMDQFQQEMEQPDVSGSL